VLINGRRYPVVGGGVASAHTLIDAGPEDPAILPAEVGARTKLGFYQLITKFSALLPRTLVRA
jgi:hypothetical protein